MLIRLLKLPIKLAALSLIPVLLALHFAGAIVLGLSSVITNLLATVFLLGSLAGWVVHNEKLLHTREQIKDRQLQCRQKQAAISI